MRASIGNFRIGSQVYEIQTVDERKNKERTEKTATIVYLRFSVGGVVVVIGGGGGSRWNFMCALENLLGYL